MKKLLSPGNTNAKTIKNELETYILYLAPWKQNSFGKNLCADATEGCIKACLYHQGRGKFSNVQLARISKTDYFVSDRKGFMNDLVAELDKLNEKAGKKGELIAIRLNGTSDLDWWPLIYNTTGKKIFDFPNLLFYDYTKSFKRALNYTDMYLAFKGRYPITYSFNERSKADEVQAILEAGGNVAIVLREDDFEGKTIQVNGKKYPVLDGDKSDLVMTRERGVFLGLRAKGTAKKDKSGFVRSVYQAI